MFLQCRYLYTKQQGQLYAKVVQHYTHTTIQDKVRTVNCLKDTNDSDVILTNNSKGKFPHNLLPLFLPFLPTPSQLHKMMKKTSYTPTLLNKILNFAEISIRIDGMNSSPCYLFCLYVHPCIFMLCYIWMLSSLFFFISVLLLWVS